MKSTRVQDIKNYFFPTGKEENSVLVPDNGSKDINKNLSKYITPVQFQRFRQDIKSWRDATTELEHAYYPQRVKLQRIFIDTVLNSQVQACMTRRKELTMLRDFKICNSKGVGSDELKALFRNNGDTIGINEQTTNWFDSLLSYTLDAVAYGYSLISLGDLVNNSFPNLSLVKRWNVSPDRFNVTSYVYALSGMKFNEDPYKDWHIYISTPSEHGVSPCGYGYLFKVAPYEIFLRNNIGYNADFNEMFNQPMRVGSTTKTEEAERAEFEAALRNAGSLSYILKDDGTDTVEFLESKNVGTAYQSYDNFDVRLEKKISKIILGHADAIDSVPGKLGSGQGANKGTSPVDQALDAVQRVDGIMCQNVVNSMLLPRMRKFGIKIPLDYHFEFLNDSEIQENKDKEVDYNSKVADMTLKFFQAGLKIDGKYITEQTTIPVTEIQTPNLNPDDNNPTPDKVF